MLGQIEVRRSVSAAVAGPGVSSTFTCPMVDMSSIGMTTSISSALRMPGIDDLHRPLHPRLGPPTQELGYLLQGPLGGGQPDALQAADR